MSKLFKAVLGIGGAAAAVVLSKKENRDRLKDEYGKYKSNPESYKQNAKDIASQISSKAGETYSEVKQDPKGYLKDQKNHFKNGVKKEDVEIEEARFDDEGGDPSNNLRVVTEEELKNNSNKRDNK